MKFWVVKTDAFLVEAKNSTEAKRMVKDGEVVAEGSSVKTWCSELAYSDLVGNAEEDDY